MDISHAQDSVRLDAGARHAGAGGEDVSSTVEDALEVIDEFHVLNRVRQVLGRGNALLTTSVPRIRSIVQMSPLLEFGSVFCTASLRPSWERIGKR